MATKLATIQKCACGFAALFLCETYAWIEHEACDNPWLLITALATRASVFSSHPSLPAAVTALVRAP